MSEEGFEKKSQKVLVEVCENLDLRHSTSHPLEIGVFVEKGRMSEWSTILTSYDNLFDYTEESERKNIYDDNHSTACCTSIFRDMDSLRPILNEFFKREDIDVRNLKEVGSFAGSDAFPKYTARMIERDAKKVFEKAREKGGI